MPAHHDDDLPTLDLADLAGVTGGGADAMSSMLPMMLMMRGRSQAAAPPAPPPAPWKPKILVDGVEQQVTSSGNATTFTSST
ncbi:MAG TPA: hypothetical protein VFK02_27450 [Kofleriaceae bacterium]|nr:hypothetical protein [Kofleriaceae bacterium]